MGIVLIIQLIIKAVFTILAGNINSISQFGGVFSLTETLADDKIAALYRKPL
jgi:hypothetical protein